MRGCAASRRRHDAVHYGNNLFAMIILGINAFHADSSAALVQDGKLIAAAEEERFRRIKHWAGFRPRQLLTAYASHVCSFFRGQKWICRSSRILSFREYPPHSLYFSGCSVVNTRIAPISLSQVSGVPRLLREGVRSLRAGMRRPTVFAFIQCFGSCAREGS